MFVPLFSFFTPLFFRLLFLLSFFVPLFSPFLLSFLFSLISPPFFLSPLSSPLFFFSFPSFPCYFCHSPRILFSFVSFFSFPSCVFCFLSFSLFLPLSPPLLFAFPFPLICLPFFSSFYFPPTFISFSCSPFLLLLNIYFSLHSFFFYPSFSPRPFPHSFLLCAHSATCLCYTHIPI